ncbi:MAG TPA: outer membrane protein assembly factor BamA [Bacteroidia bacterium]|jgi:outer membrane protein insertion porin family|nr:outer membrane protein assembly factor BamA [Bacteroidia bacterium]
MKYRKFTIIFSFLLVALASNAQLTQSDSTSKLLNSTAPVEYTIGDIDVSGADHFDKKVLILLSGLTVGDKVQVPGEKFSTAIENLWKQGLFGDIKIVATKIQGSYIFLRIDVTERPRIFKFAIRGVKKSEADDIRDKITSSVKGKVATEGLIASTQQKIKDFFVTKGYMDTKVQIAKEPIEKMENSVALLINIDKGSKVRIKDINIKGNSSIKTWKLRRTFKETKRRRWWNPFNNGKFDEENYEKDKKALLAKYNEKGYRDAKIVKDTMYRVSSNRVSVDMEIVEGKKYYFRNITWVGNTKYTADRLSKELGIKKGDVYDQSQLDAKLFMNPNGFDISSLYMDDGYLFFNITPIEVNVKNDSIDLEMRIYEGKQATINKVTVTGNTKTNDRVIMREIRTRPGQLFRRTDIIRSQRELSQLGYFDPEKMGVTPTPNQATGMVDIDYQVEEKPSDQIELSGGYGGGRVVGTLGVTFNNFSAKNFFKKETWRPLPSGDGQRFSMRAQSNGLYYQSYNISFTEPWLGGKKPTSLSVTGFYSVQSNGEKKFVKVDGDKVSNPLRQSLNIMGVSLGLGKRLKKPDDFFSLYQELSYQYYVLNNYGAIFNFQKGYSNNIYYKLSIQRNSIDKPIFETRGSNIALTGQWTPPYSSFNGKNYGPTMTDQERYKFVEYQKYKFTTNFFIPITNKRGVDGKEARNLILRTAAGFGFLTSYNSKVGVSPFERFYLGGSGLTGYSLDGREIIALRGYSDQSLSPLTGATYIAKYTAELRFPVTLNPQATIYMLGFAEAGNSWTRARDFNPFNVKRSAGVGVRVFLPMFGLIGFDYGWRLDEMPAMQKGQFHFTIGASIGEL